MPACFSLFYIIHCTHSIHYVSLIELNVTISANYTAAPGEESGDLGPNTFTAGSVLSRYCIVLGNSGALTYTWSVIGNSPTPGCTSCGSASSTTSTLVVGSPLFSYYAGIYTCTVMRVVDLPVTTLITSLLML